MRSKYACPAAAPPPSGCTFEIEIVLIYATTARTHCGVLDRFSVGVVLLVRLEFVLVLDLLDLGLRSHSWLYLVLCEPRVELRPMQQHAARYQGRLRSGCR